MSARQKHNVRLDDVYGAKDAKKEIKSVIEVLKSFKRLGLRQPRGVLLSGAPRTGKTMLAKAIATETGLQFIQCNASDDGVTITALDGAVRKMVEDKICADVA